MKLKKYIHKEYLLEGFIFNLICMGHFLTSIEIITIISVVICVTLITKKLFSILLNSKRIKNQQLINQHTYIMKLNRYNINLHLINRLNYEVQTFCWIINKFNFRCWVALGCVFIIFFGIDCVDQTGSVSWAIMGNVIILYLNLRNRSKDWIKIKFNLFKDYRSYVVIIKQPSSSPQKNKRDSLNSISILSDQEIQDINRSTPKFNIIDSPKPLFSSFKPLN